MLKIVDIKYRKEPIKHTKMQHLEEKNNLVKRKTDKLYDYYICDYCGAEINSLTKCGDLKVALCNKCVRGVQKQLEK